MHILEMDLNLSAEDTGQTRYRLEMLLIREVTDQRGYCQSGESLEMLQVRKQVTCQKHYRLETIPCKLPGRAIGMRDVKLLVYYGGRCYINIGPRSKTIVRICSAVCSTAFTPYSHESEPSTSCTETHRTTPCLSPFDIVLIWFTNKSCQSVRLHNNTCL